MSSEDQALGRRRLGVVVCAALALLLLSAVLLASAPWVSAAHAAVTVSTLAGKAGEEGSTDGTGASARFCYPVAAACDAAGNLYVADSSDCTIRMVTPAGVVTTVAGKSRAPGSVDGSGSKARFNHPQGIACDAAGNLYVADKSNMTVRKIDHATGMVSTLAGKAGAWGSKDGAGADARFFGPAGIACDAAGNVYVGDCYVHPLELAGQSASPNRDGGQTIRKITPAGVVTTLAGTSGTHGSADGTGAAARFNGPNGIACDAAGNLYVADAGNNSIRKVTPKGVVTTLAGGSDLKWGDKDGTGAAARFYGPNGIACDAAGNFYVADYSNNKIRKVTAKGVVTSVAGGGYLKTGYKNGSGGAARFRYPSGVATDAHGNVYVADTNNMVIRKIAPAQVTLALSGLRSGSLGRDQSLTANGRVRDEHLFGSFFTITVQRLTRARWRTALSDSVPISDAGAFSWTHRVPKPGLYRLRIAIAASAEHAAVASLWRHFAVK